jgi:3-dehydroquinate synthase
MLFEINTDKAIKIEANQPAKPLRARPIFVGEDWYDEMVRMIKEFVGDHMLAAVVDQEVARLYPERLEQLRSELPRVRIMELKGGESAKSFEVFVQIHHFLQEQEVHRDDHILSMGGGSISDVTGFVAATYMRGMSWISVPTTLIAQADCAIGGKTAINSNTQKNYTGAFYWPNVVFSDTSFLKTLSTRSYRSAIPEIAKLALIGDAARFKEMCEMTGEGRGDAGIKPKLKELIAYCAELKSRISAEDPFQVSQRVVFLTGHTTAHALEAASNLKLRHGEAVAMGLAFESFISEKRQMISPEDRKALIDLLESCHIPKSQPAELHDRRVLECMSREKRNRGRSVSFVLPCKPGQAMANWPAPRQLLSRDEVWHELAAYRQVTF